MRGWDRQEGARRGRTVEWREKEEPSRKGDALVRLSPHTVTPSPKRRSTITNVNGAKIGKSKRRGTQDRRDYRLAVLAVHFSAKVQLRYAPVATNTTTS